jgi:hypothetical protein
VVLACSLFGPSSVTRRSLRPNARDRRDWRGHLGWGHSSCPTHTGIRAARHFCKLYRSEIPNLDPYVKLVRQRGFLVTRGDATELLEAIDAALDEVPSFVGFAIIIELTFYGSIAAG